MIEFGTIQLHAKWIVCPKCEGSGKIPLEGHVFTAQDFADDPDFRHDYFGGVYDKPCSVCKGRTTVEEVDREHPDNKPHLAAYDAHLDDEEYDDAMYRAENRHLF